jgi:hypothetical protein
VSIVSHRRAAVVAAIGLLVAMVWLSRDFGFTWDERFQQKYGEEIWDYARGDLPRATFDTNLGNQYLYGGLVEILCVTAQHLFRATDPYILRHMVIAVFGWSGIVFCGLLAGRAFGPRAGWLAAALLALSPRYIGDAMNNPKDAPFAALAMAALYFALALDERPPYFSWRQAAKLGAAIALAINVRPLGLMLLGFSCGVVLAFVLLQTLRSAAPERWRVAGATVLRLAIMAVVVVPLGTVFWPWAQAEPFIRPIQGFLISAQANWAAGFDVLYAGQVYGAGTLPWHYVPRWLLMALPPVVIAGLMLSGLVWLGTTRARLTALALALFVAAPVAGAVWRNATIYDGIRHILFVVPPLTVLAGAGWSAALATSGTRRLLVIALLLLGVGEVTRFQLTNHPHQIVYFSPLVGGPRAAFARYDMDYWGNSMLEAVTWSASLASDLKRPLGVSGNPIQAVQADAGRYHSLYVSPRNARDFHFDIRLLRGPPDSLRAFASSANVLHRVTTADGTPLCVVLPGPAYGEIAAAMAERGLVDRN